MQHRRSTQVLTVLTLILALFVVAACAGGQAPAPAAPTGGEEAAPAPSEGEPVEAPEEPVAAEAVLVHARPTDSGTLDPGQMTQGESWKVVAQIYDTLVRYKPGTFELEPALAESWEVSDDGLEWTFHLRDDVTFHDGTPLNAEAVAFTFERARDENHPYHQYGAWDNWSWYMYMVNQVEAVDEYTVRFTLDYAYAPFLQTLANYATAIVSPTAFREEQDDFAQNPVGSGPYRFVEWAKDDRIVLEKNSEYWDGEPGLDRLIYRVIPEHSARLSALQTGEVHVVDQLPPEMATIVQNEDGLTLDTKPGLNISYLRWNTVPEYPGYQEPLGDVRVRRALAHAIDREALRERFFGDFGEVATNPIPSLVWGRDESLELPEYDPERARELLAEAGYGDGFETELLGWTLVRSYWPEPVPLTEAIQGYLQEIGVDAKIRVVEYGIWAEETAAGEAPMHIGGWTGDFGDPDNFLATIWDDELTGRQYGWRNEEFRNLLVEAQKATDRDERIDLYHQAQAIFFEELPGLPLFHGKYVTGYRDTVQNLVVGADGGIRYTNVTMAEQ